jgi:hypothetical protein
MMYRLEAHLSKSRKLIIYRTNRFLERFFKCAADAHNFAHTLHAAAQETTDPIEFFQIPARNLDDYVVQTWLEAGAGYFGDGVLDLVEWDPKANLSSNEREGVSSGFGGQGGRTGKSSVNLENSSGLDDDKTALFDVILTSIMQYS